MKEKILTILLIAAAITSFFAYAMWIHATTNRSRLIPSSGVIAIGDVGIYWEPECLNNVTFIDWGIIDVGENTTQRLFVRNEGTVKLRLSYNTTNWNPTNASDYISLVWNYDNRTFLPDEILPVTLTLSVSLETTGITTFSFDITVFTESVET